LCFFILGYEIVVIHIFHVYLLGLCNGHNRMQVAITTTYAKLASLNPPHGEVYSIQHQYQILLQYYVIFLK
jgi:hypothetical protein